MNDLPYHSIDDESNTEASGESVYFPVAFVVRLTAEDLADLSPEQAAGSMQSAIASLVQDEEGYELARPVTVGHLQQV